MSAREYVERRAAGIPPQEWLAECLEGFGLADGREMTLEAAGELWQAFCR